MPDYSCPEPNVLARGWVFEEMDREEAKARGWAVVDCEIDGTEKHVARCWGETEDAAHAAAEKLTFTGNERQARPCSRGLYEQLQSQDAVACRLSGEVVYWVYEPCPNDDVDTWALAVAERNIRPEMTGNEKAGFLELLERMASCYAFGEACVGMSRTGVRGWNHEAKVRGPMLAGGEGLSPLPARLVEAAWQVSENLGVPAVLNVVAGIVSKNKETRPN